MAICPCRSSMRVAAREMAARIVSWPNEREARHERVFERWLADSDVAQLNVDACAPSSLFDRLPALLRIRDHHVEPIAETLNVGDLRLLTTIV